MKVLFLQFVFLGMISFPFTGISQGTISPLFNQETTIENSHTANCGSHHLMVEMNNQNENYMNLSNELMDQLSNLITMQKEDRIYDDLYEIPVVFHIVYSNSDQNLHDSVILNQIEVLNNCFRRTNDDTVNTRNVFHSLVGDSKIEFKLADIDPFGNPTTGITRTPTNITHFGGILPYNQSQTQQIQQWVNDSLFYNFFRLTQTNLGGKDPWNTDNYLNIWIGDLRILEPQINNFEELVFFGLATPPSNHQNWPDSVLQMTNGFHQGVLMHYVNIGANNPNLFPTPYGVYNNLVKEGKMLVHEVGHYLGLRHIWGDGGCNVDDYVSDTPLASAASNYNCNQNANNCIDNINGQDLPNMIENYMDYSDANCQNSFTIGQNDIMRAVLENFRIDLPTIISTASLPESNFTEAFNIYPNPNQGIINLDFEHFQESIELLVINTMGQIVFENKYKGQKTIALSLNLDSGVYFVQTTLQNGRQISQKILVEN
jgi:hypothetical protein